MKTTITLIRHCHVYNPKNIFYGRLPGFRLSKQGKKQAQLLSLELKPYPVAAIFSSPLLRARQTAREIIKCQPHLKLRISAALTEIFTPFEGVSNAVVDAREGDVYSGTAPEFEQPIDIVNRVRKFICRVRKTYSQQHITAVTHGDIIVFMTLWACGQPLTVANKKNLKPWGITDRYPALGSITTFIYRKAESNELPQISYLKPY